LNYIPVLVTAAGSELALGIIKACRVSKIPVKVVACDMDGDALGLLWADEGYHVPGVKADQGGYLEALSDIVAREGVRLIIPTADAEMEVMPRHRQHFYDKFGCSFIINDASMMDIFNDKWKTYLFCREKGIPAPETACVCTASEVKRLVETRGYPLVLKPRFGGGSRRLFIINGPLDLDRFLPIVPDGVLQEYLYPDEEEYTAGTFRTFSGEVHVITLRRRLKFGMTYKAEVVFDPALDNFCRAVILNTELVGSNNIQFRNTRQGPRIVEINPRFSGTAGLRAVFGFNDVEMAIRQYVLGEEVPPPFIRPGKVLRYFHEEYVGLGT